jgi:hypothetical protein
MRYLALALLLFPTVAHGADACANVIRYADIYYVPTEASRSFAAASVGDIVVIENGLGCGMLQTCDRKVWMFVRSIDRKGGGHLEIEGWLKRRNIREFPCEGE